MQVLKKGPPEKSQATDHMNHNHFPNNEVAIDLACQHYTTLPNQFGP